MTAKDVIKQTLDQSDMIVGRYVGDLGDEELKVRPAPGMNSIAWQLGHLLSVERRLVETIKPGSGPELPAGFDEAHSKEAGKSDDTSKYASKDEYLRLFAAQRAATKAVLDGLTDEELQAAPANTFNGMVPTTAHLFNFLGLHVMMHVGQFVPVRRSAGKPIVI